MFTKPATNCFGFNTRSPNDLMPRLSIYTCCTNYGSFLVLETSWSAYRNLLMQPSKLGIDCTPYQMCGKTIEASGCFHVDHTMGCFPFLYVGVLDVPTSSSLYS
jgi:hypothetical protein